MRSDRAMERRARRWFLRIESREEARLMVALNFEVLKFLPRRASIFFPMTDADASFVVFCLFDECLNERDVLE